MQTLTHSLYVISNLLLGPVVVALLVMLAWTICLFGGFLRECLERKSVRKCLQSMLSAAHRDETGGTVWKELSASRSGLPMRFFRLLNQSPTDDEHVLNRALSELEHHITESIARHSFIIRVGPMLGLMGTLIPLGPALTGLAGGNLQAMASNLVVAFTTTVVGLFISGIAYGMATARRTWYGRDFNDLELVCEKLAGK